MFVLVMGDGSQQELIDRTFEDAMRTMVRKGAHHLVVMTDPPQRLSREVVLKTLHLDRPGLFDRYNDQWRAPTSEEFRDLVRLANLTRGTAALLVGVSPGKIGKWIGGQGEVPYAVWRLLTVYAGLAPADTENNK